MMAKRKPLSYYLALRYPFRADADPEGGFVISFPDLPGCVTQADTPAEIGLMAEEARTLWIETEYESGGDIPEPSYPQRYSGKFNLRLPKSLHARLAQAAEREGVSLNQYVVALLAAAQAAAEAGRAPSPFDSQPSKSLRRGGSDFSAGWAFATEPEARPRAHRPAVKAAAESDAGAE